MIFIKYLRLEKKHLRYLFSILLAGGLILTGGCAAEPTLRTAIRDHDEQLFRELTAETEDINSTVQGRTPLQWAAYYGRRDKFEQLLELGAEKNVKSSRGGTALHYATLGGRPRMVRYLLTEGGFDPNRSRNDGTTPLFLALENGRADLAELLLEFDAQLNITDNKNRTLAHAVSKSGLSGWLSKLQQSGVDLHQEDINGQTTLHVAVQNNNYTIVEDLVASYELNVNNQDARGRTPLYLAAENNRAAILDFLLKNNANPNIADDGGRTSLHGLAQSGQPEDIEKLLEEEARLNHRDESGHTPLFLALDGRRADDRNLPAAEYLLRVGGSLQEKESRFGRSDVQRMVDRYGESIAGEASRYNHPYVLNLILKRDTDIERNPLLWTAVYRGNLEAVYVLLNRGADPEAEVNDTTILDMAREEGHVDVIRTIRSFYYEFELEEDTTPDFVPPGQDPDFTPPGQDPDFTPPGQDPETAPPGQKEETEN